MGRPAPPPSCNTGGKVPHGQNRSTGGKVGMTPQKTTIDWLRLRTQAEPKQALEALRPMFGTLGPALRLKGLPRGILGFQQAAQIVVGDVPMGRMDYGGDAQRGWVRLDVPGKACEWVQDWDALQPLRSCQGRNPPPGHCPHHLGRRGHTRPGCRGPRIRPIRHSRTPSSHADHHQH